MSEPTPNVEPVDDDADLPLLTWEPSLFTTKWGEGNHSAMADVGYYPALTPYPGRPWEGVCLGPGPLKLKEWYEDPGEAMAAIEEHIAAYIDATFPDPDDDPTILMQAVHDA